MQSESGAKRLKKSLFTGYQTRCLMHRITKHHWQLATDIQPGRTSDCEPDRQERRTEVGVPRSIVNGSLLQLSWTLNTENCYEASANRPVSDVQINT